MLERIHSLAKQGKSFAFETTLAAKNFTLLLKDCKYKGYQTNLVFLWLHSVELALERVKLRIREGGHAIPIDTIIRRYDRGLENFFSLYMSIVDNWWFFDNSGNFPELVSLKLLNQPLKVLNIKIWNRCIKEYKKYKI